MRYAMAVSRFIDLAIRDVIRREVLSFSHLEDRCWAVRQLRFALDNVDADSWSAALPKGGDSILFYNKEVAHVLRKGLGTASQFHRDVLSRLDERIAGTKLSLSRVELSIGGAAWPVSASGRLSRLSRWLDREGFLATHYKWGKAEPRLYFAFVEEQNSIEPGRDVYGGDGRVLTRAEERGKLTQIRFAAIPCTNFFDAADQIDGLEPGSVSEEARRVRLQQLRENLGGADLPVIDLLVSWPPPWDFKISVGTWLVVGVRRGLATWGDVPLFLTEANDPRQQTESGPSPLGILGRVPRYWLRRLRDIFSLAHVADARVDARPGAGEASS